MSFNGKVVLITGASTGIGADAAFHLASLGAKVSIVGRNEHNLNAVADRIRKSGALVPLTIVADVRKDAQRVVDDTIKHCGKLNILINNAGIATRDNVCFIDLSKHAEILIRMYAVL